MNALIDRVRTPVKAMMTQLAKWLNSATDGKLSPNMITVFGLVMHVPIALLIASGDFLAAAILLIIFGLFDALDGALARVQGKASHKGMFLDSATDRIKEILIYTATAYYFVAIHESTVAVWAVAACGFALLVSYVNAWGEVVTNNAGKSNNHATNKTFRGGVMSFDVRIATFIIGLLLNRLELAIIVIAILSILTVLQRMTVIMRRLT